MSRIALLGALAMLVGCTSENELLGEPPPARAVNPPEPENPEQLDRIVQVQQPKVDILFVIDNSCSMLEEQTALANNFSPFMEFFTGSGLDYHIGVVSTDMDDQANHIGKLQQAGGVSYIDNSMPFQQANQIFSQMAIMGTSGSYEEKGRAAAYTMVELKPEIPRNVGFYRDEASLHMVFISDEEDHSTVDDGATRDALVRYLWDLEEQEAIVALVERGDPFELGLLALSLGGAAYLWLGWRRAGDSRAACNEGGA